MGLLAVVALSAQPAPVQVMGGIIGGVPTQVPGQKGRGGVPSGQPPGTISGKVINSITGQGIKRAVVNINGGGFGYQASTDGSGAFRIDNVEPLAGYFAAATCEGFEATSGNRGLAKQIAVSPSQDVKDVVVQLSPHASVSGKVIDRDGDPIENAQIWAMGYNYNAGTKILRVFGSTSTDDRGQFRLGDLQRGVYYIAVNARTVGVPAPSAQQNVHTQIPHEAYPEMFYPGVNDPTQATPLVVKPGDDVQSIDFRLAKVTAYRVRGAVAGGANGAGRGGVQAQRCYTGINTQPQNFVGMRMNPDGTFELSDATPGTYCIHASRPNQGNSMPFGSLTVEVRDRDIDNAVIQTAPGFDLSGVVSIEGTPPATMPRGNVALRSIEFGSGSNAVFAGDLSFALKSVFPIAYSVQFQQMQGLYVKSIRLGSQDVSDGRIVPAPGAPLLITLGTDPAQVDGTVQSSSSSPSGGWVIIYSAKYPGRNDLSRTTMINSTGGFTFPNLAPGDYKILALESSDPSDTQNLDLRTALERRAASVTVTGGGHQTVQVTTVSADDVEAARVKIR
jgi:hypothetical protein